MTRIALLLLLLICSCDRIQSERDNLMPHVVEVIPHDFVVGSEVDFELVFSEPLYKPSVIDKHIVFIKSQHVDDELLADFVDGKLSAGHQKKVIVPQIELLSNEKSIKLKPSVLSLDTDYSILLSPKLCDVNGNPLTDDFIKKAVVQIDFKTAKQAPASLKGEMKLLTAEKIPTNQKQMRIALGQPLTASEIGRVQIRPVNAELPLPNIKRIELSIDRKQLEIIFADPEQGCARLLPSAEYEIRMGSLATSLNFSTAAECDSEALKILSTPEVLSLEQDASLSLSFNKKARAYLWFGAVDGVLNCLGQSCPIMIEDNEVAAISGLHAEQKYRYVMAAEDEVGFTVHVRGEWTTELLPKIAINELMANPSVPQGISEAEAEFIELYNYGDEAIDLAGYRIDVDSGKGQATRSCIISDSSLVITPKSFLLLVGQRFSPAHYRQLDMKSTHRLKGAQVCGLLSNSAGQRLMLKDHKKRLISSYGGYLASTREGVSIERIRAEMRDEKSNFRHSHPDEGPSPGKANPSSMRAFRQ